MLRSILTPLKIIPLLDSVGTPLLAGIFLALLWLQSRFPLRYQHFVAFRRLVRNLVLSAPSNAVFRWLMLPVPLVIASWAQDRDVGLLNWIPQPGWVRRS